MTAQFLDFLQLAMARGLSLILDKLWMQSFYNMLGNSMLAPFLSSSNWQTLLFIAFLLTVIVYAFLRFVSYILKQQTPLYSNQSLSNNIFGIGRKTTYDLSQELLVLLEEEKKNNTELQQTTNHRKRRIKQIQEELKKSIQNESFYRQ